MNIQLNGKNALICGSTQGIGKACAIELARLGANITLFARNPEQLKAVCSELDTAQDQQHDYLSADFDKPEQVQETLIVYLSETSKKMHILVNNTGGPPSGRITDAQSKDFLSAYQRHLICNQLLAMGVLEGMKQAKYGRIINIISTSVKEPLANLGVSNTTRWAVAAWAKTWANEVAVHGITVNNVLPGYTDTARLRSLIGTMAAKQGKTEEQIANEMLNSVPMLRFADAHEIAAAVAFLASPAASYINGINLPVDGGRTKSL